MCKMLLNMTKGKSFRVNLDAFTTFKSRVKFNPMKLKKEIDMTTDFYYKCSFVSSSQLVKPLNHLYNGELLHDCYYDVEDSDMKLVFFNSFKCFKKCGDKYVLSSPHIYQYSSGFFRNATGINLVQGDRDLQYFRFVKNSYDCLVIF